MAKVFIDTNVLLDMLLEERPGNGVAKTLFGAAKAGIFDGYITTQSIIDAHFTASKNGLSFNAFKSAIQFLRSFIRILAIDELDLLWAIGNPTGDFEDDAQYGSAYNGVCDFFITRDNALFKLNSPFCPMTVMTPSEFVAGMEIRDE
ncbi:MAG: PIN domain-containing protein [Bacteroidales bacterium]|nr:PIN domain-containing protein [Bacteroidales bacterium]